MRSTVGRLGSEEPVAHITPVLNGRGLRELFEPPLLCSQRSKSTGVGGRGNCLVRIVPNPLEGISDTKSLHILVKRESSDLVEQLT